MTNRPPLNPDALEAASRVNDPEAWAMIDDIPNDPGAMRLRESLIAEAGRTVSAYLAVAQQEVTSVPGVYDIGSPEPEGVDYVVECDERGVATDYLCSDAFSGYWSKTMDGTRWKGYQDGKVYMSWSELVRRVGPVKAVNDA